MTNADQIDAFCQATIPNATPLEVNDHQRPVGFACRFKGHLCTAIRSGIAKEPILVRKRRADETFIAKIDYALAPKQTAIRRSRIVCARLIRNTERVRFKMKDTHFEDLAGAPSVKRLMLDYGTANRRGKRWKICPIW